MHAAEAYDMCASGYRDWRWSALWDTIEVPAVIENLPAGGTLLDLGCGYGRYAGPCISHGLHYRGVDASEEMLRLASEQRASFVRADLYEYRSTVLADAILCTRVLSNLQDPIRAIASISRNLMPGGTFVVTDFHERHEFDRQTIEGRDGTDVIIPVFRHSRDLIRRAIRLAQLVLVEERVLREAADRPVLVMYRGIKPV